VNGDGWKIDMKSYMWMKCIILHKNIRECFSPCKPKIRTKSIVFGYGPFLLYNLNIDFQQSPFSCWVLGFAIVTSKKVRYHEVS
jgi:hypothetical protein